ncbi:hypothetical protein FGG08_005412 [Glutinoglossum americanum]|uniref:WD repeat-containing protein 6 n=1 Tax=Glutinoglossum americanum TaxID=1670608 RepID=A0A9P8KW26_9PEZI|nr:hypothetical protein FGG08_005412 [Glutinoglossum americanum]
MAEAFEHESILNPVTALSFLHVQAHKSLLLAGEGPFLKIYEHGSARILLQQRIFKTQAIHGIAIEIERAIPFQPARVLLWGGSSIRAVEISYLDDAPDLGVVPRVGIRLWPGCSAQDWILDACFSPHEGGSHVRAALITAHNSLHLLTLHNDQKIRTIGSSSRSILYSAHVLWISDSCVLVAAGTAFGEILVWSCCFPVSPNPHASASESRTLLHYTLTGHEGSIFGVRISPPLALSGGCPKRFLASCSDDRTIRIWDITAEYASGNESQAEPCDPAGTGFRPADSPAPHCWTGSENLVAIGWGHSSRVWGVRFLPTDLEFGHHTHQIHILSFAEDTTCRQWTLKYGGKTTSNTAASKLLKLVQTYNSHSGKNIWSLAVMAMGSRLLVSTAGADGKIATVCLPTAGDGATLNQQDDVGWSVEGIEILSGANVPNSEITKVDPPKPPPATHEGSSRAGNRDRASETLTLSSQLTQNIRSVPPDSFKDYVFVSQADFLATTAQGKTFLCSIDTSSGTKRNSHRHLDENSSPSVIKCKLLAYLERLKAYSVLGGDPDSGTAFLSGSDGTVYLYDHSFRDLRLLFQVSGKVSGLFPVFSPCLLQVLVTCIGSREAYFSTLEANQERSRWPVVGLDRHPEDSPTTILGLPETFVVTSAGTASTQYLVLGSRSGALAVYDRSKMPDRGAKLAPVACFRRAHGVDAITTIIPLPEYSNSLTDSPTYILTAGRNGTYSIYQISENVADSSRNITLETVHVSAPPFGPMVEGAYFSPLTHELTLFGFRSKNFIVWNASRECEIMNVECGGAHRNWAFSPSPNGGGIFVWTKSSKLNLHIQPDDSQRIIKGGGHGREIKAVAISPLLTMVSRSGEKIERQLLATGAEDTAIRIFELTQDSSTESTSGETFKSLGTFKKHTTGIQQLQWTECGRYLISSGGFEELFIWRVRWIPGFGIGVYCECVCPVKAGLPDLRIMSFIAGNPHPLPAGDRTSSDKDAGFVITTAYRYLPRPKTLRLLLLGRYATCCLTQVFHQQTSNDTYILTAGTDGYVALWRTTTLLNKRCLGEVDDNGGVGSVAWHWRSRVHQSAVKSMAVVQTSPRSILAITGGDDNSLALTHITFSHNNSVKSSPSSTTTRIPKAHASAITGITQIASHTADSRQRILFASSGNDQRLKLWSVGLHDKEGLEIVREGNVGTSVADVSGMVAGRRDERGAKVVVTGVGMEAWGIELQGGRDKV